MTPDGSRSTAAPPDDDLCWPASGLDAFGSGFAPGGAISGIGPVGPASVGLIESSPALTIKRGCEHATTATGITIMAKMRNIAIAPRGYNAGRPDYPGPG